MFRPPPALPAQSTAPRSYATRSREILVGKSVRRAPSLCTPTPAIQPERSSTRGDDVAETLDEVIGEEIVAVEPCGRPARDCWPARNIAVAPASSRKNQALGRGRRFNGQVHFAPLEGCHTAPVLAA